jgi:nicotinate-nucleotide adenylyltransferase
MHYREGLGLAASQIFFITGADAFADIETWSRYPAVLDLAHFIAVSRPGTPAGSLRKQLPALKNRMRLPRRRCDLDGGRSNTAIFLVDAPTSDVSSTEIRRRMRASESLSGLVPEAIERHIHQHRLYQQPLSSTGADHLHGES